MKIRSSHKHSFFMLEVLLSLLFVSVIGTAILYSSFSSQKSSIRDVKLYAIPRARSEAAVAAYCSITPKIIQLLHNGSTVSTSFSFTYDNYTLTPRVTLSLCEERAMIQTKQVLYKIACTIECESSPQTTYYFLFSTLRDKKI